MKNSLPLIYITTLMSLTACKLPLISKEIAQEIAASVPTSASLYVASGACYAGGVVTASPSNQILKYRLDTGAKVATTVDYRNQTPGDSPVGIAGLNSNSVISVVENVNGRHLDEIDRNGRSGSLYLVNATAFIASLRGISKTTDGSFLITRTTSIEKFTAFRTRVLNGGAAFINAPVGACSAMTTALTFAIELKSGKVLVGHAGSTPNNKIALFNNGGYSVVGDCLSAGVAPTITAMPVAAVEVSNDTFLVAYASVNPADNKILAYKIDTSISTNLAIATVKTVLSNPSLMMGASAMVYDADTQSVFVASAPATSEKIERFTWDNTAQTLTRVGSRPFLVDPNLSCVSSMYIGD
jgi:hypothetical protein